ncbi:MAG: PaaI family thioesterase [Bryobacteraceae bacterium]
MPALENYEGGEGHTFMKDEKQPRRTKTVTWENPRIARSHARKLSGSEFFDKMRRGEIPEPPFGRLLGMDLFDAGEGHFVMTLEPQEVHYNPMGCVHGGILATLLDSVMSAAVHTALPVGRGYLTLEIKVNFLRPVFEATGEIIAEGNVVSLGKQVATAEGKITDAKGNLHATGTATCIVFDAAAGPPSQE